MPMFLSDQKDAPLEAANKAFKMVELTDGFETNAEDVTIAVGMRKDDTRITQVNEVFRSFF